MARTGRPKAELVLTEDERETLARWARRRNSSQALALRCRIVLESATGAANKDVAARLGVEAHTVSRWRARFVRDRLEGLTDEPRPGGPRKITDDQVEEVVVRTLESAPRDATHWSTRPNGQRGGPVPVGDLTDPADFRPQAPPGGHLQPWVFSGIG
ncbi:helix-turn-helix domain-containing protein [Streptomyces sp. NPDC126514]|uniref:helix-turn-helix domain-containing protein n=1 Tax=Streptomyces sp. NPDC126514 TaxID=3155210 RepID=UPI0033296062